MLVDVCACYEERVRNFLSESEFSRGLQCCSDIEKASQSIGAGEIDLILLCFDAQSKSELATFVRLHARSPLVPIIILSEETDDIQAKNAVKAGAQDFLPVKKLSSGLLTRSIRYSLERNKLLSSLKRGAQELQSSRAQLRHIIDRSGDGIIIVDQTGICRFINSAGEQFYQRKAVDLLGKPFEILRQPGDTVEQEVFLADGERKIAEIRIERIDWEGKVGYLASLRDVTERRRVEEALSDSEDRLFQILGNIPVGVYVLDKNLRKFYSNSRAHEIMGDDFFRNEQNNSGEFFCYPGTQTPYPVNKIIVNTALQGKVVRNELIEKHTAGQVYFIEMTAGPVYNNNAKISLAVATFVDITERRKFEEQFRQAQKMESVGLLAGGVAHDFNNQLSVILGYCEMSLEDKSLNEEISSNLFQIKEAGEKASEVTRQLLAFSRKQVLFPEVLDLSRVVHTLKKILGRLIGDHIKISTRLVKIPRSVYLDRGQLEQAILNLVINGRDAMKKGGRLSLKVENVEIGKKKDNVPPREREIKKGSYVKLIVSDTGEGIKKEDLSRVFEPFFSTKEKNAGTGLGLAMVHGFVTQSGGVIQVYSKRNFGTKFELFFPVTEKTFEPISQEKKEVSFLNGSETVLLVEDEAGVRELTSQILKKKGYQVLTAATPLEAMDVLYSYNKTIHLLLTDVVMPGMSGVDLAVRAKEIRPEIKILYMSGYPEGEISKMGLRGQFNVFLEKPVTPQRLGQKVRQILDLV